MCVDFPKKKKRFQLSHWKYHLYYKLLEDELIVYMVMFVFYNKKSNVMKFNPKSYTIYLYIPHTVTLLLWDCLCFFPNIYPTNFFYLFYLHTIFLCTFYGDYISTNIRFLSHWLYGSKYHINRVYVICFLIPYWKIN